MNFERYLNNKLTPWTIFFLAIMIMVPMVILEKIPARDIATRYAPLAEAFARGDWQYAFHPRVPMLHPFLAGIIAYITGCSGFNACKIVSAIFYSLCAFPAYALFLLLFRKNVAILGTLMTILCSHLIRLGYSGLRESIKEFAIILGVYSLIAVYKNREKLRGYIYCALACAMLMTTRVDVVLYALILLFVLFIIDVFKDYQWHAPWRSVCAGIFVIILISPALVYSYKSIGYPVTEARLGIVMSKIAPFIYNSQAVIKLPGHGDNKVSYEEKIDSFLSGVGIAKNDSSTKVQQPPATASGSIRFTVNKKMVLDFISSVIDGFYPFFAILALPVIIIRIRRKLWKREESIVLGTLIAHTLVVTLQIIIFDRCLYVSTRYLTPAAPLSFGWAAIFIIFVYGYLREQFPKYVIPVWTRVGASILIVVLLGDAWGPLIKDFTSKKKSRERQASLTIAPWIENDFVANKQYVPRNLTWKSYLSNKAPVVYGEGLSVVGYMAGGQDFRFSFPLPPNYIIFRVNQNENVITIKDGKMVKEFDIAGNIYRVYRRNIL